MAKKKLNLTSMSPADYDLLDALLKQHPDAQTFYPHTSYPVKIIEQEGAEQTTLVKVSFANELVVFKNNKNQLCSGQHSVEKKIGKGGNGSIYRMDAVLVKKDDTFKLAKTPYVIKISRSNKVYETEQAVLTRRAHAFEQFFPHTKIKPPIIYNRHGVQFYSASVMKSLGNKDMQSFIDSNNKLFSSKKKSSPDLLIDISIKTLTALQQQVHDALLVHGDVKPSNIMLTTNGDAVEQVNMIDFDFVHELNEPIKKYGTMVYWPPEISALKKAEQIRAQQSMDIFPMGLTLMQLWRGYLTFRSEDKPVKPEKYQIRTGRLDACDHLFAGLTKLMSPEHLSKIHLMLQRMVDQDPLRRPSPEEVIMMFEEVRLERQPLATDQLKTLKKCQRIAAKLRAELNNIAQYEFSNFESAMQNMRNAFDTALSRLPDSQVGLQHFLSVLNIQSLKELTVSADVKKRVHEITEQYEHLSWN